MATSLPLKFYQNIKEYHLYRGGGGGGGSSTTGTKNPKNISKKIKSNGKYRSKSKSKSRSRSRSKKGGGESKTNNCKDCVKKCEEYCRSITIVPRCLCGACKANNTIKVCINKCIEKNCPKCSHMKKNPHSCEYECKNFK